jgi:predicted alpha/beta hydrolase
MITVSHNDSAQNKAVVFKSLPQSVTTIVFLPAMGVRAIYYKSFANALKLEGFNVVLMDWRGSGSSTIRASRKTNFGYEQLINDVHDLVFQVKAEFPNNQIVIAGHSLGGQIGALLACRYSDYFKALVLITTCNVHFKGWSGMGKLKVLLAGITFYPLSLLIGYFPGTAIGFGGREARSVMKDWCANALTGNYSLSSSTFNYDKALGELNIPVLALSVENDTLASKPSVVNFLNKLDGAPVTHLHLSAKDLDVSPLNHFSWVKKPHHIAKLISNFISNFHSTV